MALFVCVTYLREAYVLIEELPAKACLPVTVKGLVNQREGNANETEPEMEAELRGGERVTVTMICRPGRGSYCSCCISFFCLKSHA